METTELEGAYERFFAAASADRFDEPAGTWPAARVIAHVAANDALLARHIASALAGETPRYDNRPALDEGRLDDIVEATGTWDRLIALGRARSRRVLELAGEVSGELAGRAFHVFILDGDVVQVDEPVPIPGLLAAQARVHVPAHAEELERLEAVPVTARLA